MNNKGFFGLIGLLLTVAIISCFAYYVFVHYYGKPADVEQNTQAATGQSDIETASPTTQIGVLDRARSMIKGAQEAEDKQSQ